MVEDLTKQIVASCEAAVWTRIQPLASSMDPAQSRGYIRARSTQVIVRETERVVEQLEDANATLAERLRSSVTESIVRKMVARIATQHPTEFRRAA